MEAMNQQQNEDRDDLRVEDHQIDGLIVNQHLPEDNIADDHAHSTLQHEDPPSYPDTENNNSADGHDASDNSTLDQEDPLCQPSQKKTLSEYVNKHKLNEKLHHDSPLSKLDCLLMILHLAVRHCHTQKFIEDQIQFVNSLFGSTVLDVTYFIFQNIFPSSKSIERHFYCDNCEIYIGSRKDFPEEDRSTKCRDCGADIDIKSIYSGNYFITLSIKEQIEDLLKRSDIKLVDVEERDPDIIADIFDGEHYKKCCEPGGAFRKKALTVNFNTDGVKVYESVNDSMYPILMHLNEIVPELRFKTENLILGGLWYGKSAPNMALFMKPFLSQLIDLSVHGVSVPQPNGAVFQIPVFPLCCSVDSVAKAKVVCQRQFNGGFSCLYCYHPNDSVADEENSHLKYFDTSVNYPLRQELEVVGDMYQADELERKNELKNSSVNGFLGMSILLMFMKYREQYSRNPFHIIWGVVIDYLHALLEGTASTLLGLYKSILSPAQLEILNNRLSQIKLPQGMSRKPRRLDAKVKYKAKEFRSFFLYFAVPCFEDLLPARNFANLKLFVHALHIFLGDKISRRALHQAKLDMDNFVTGFQRLYGLHNVTYNLHLCSHIFHLVLQNGPLWAYSNFIFESGNGVLSRLVRGSRTVVNEIAVKFTRLQSAVKCMIDQPISNEALKFCSEVVKTKFKKSFRVDDLAVSSVSYVEFTAEEKSLFEQNNISGDNQKVKVYNKAIRGGIIYCSYDTNKSTATNDSCIRLSDDSYAVIKKILMTEEQKLVCLIQSLRLSETDSILPSIILRCAYDVLGDVSIVPFREISRKCVFISFDQKHFVCNMPNLYERD